MQKDFEAFIGQGEQAQGRSWKLAKERTTCVCEKEKKKKEGEGVWGRLFFSSYVWRGAHGKCVCKD